MRALHEQLAPVTDELRLLREFPAMIWRSRPTDGLCDWFNDTWLAFTGRSMDDEFGDGWAQGVHPDDLDRCLTTYRQAFTARRPFSMEYRLRRHDGTYRRILDLGRPYDDAHGTFGGYIGACYDVTDRRDMIDRLQAAHTTTTLFLQTLYHDLRTPAATLRMAADALTGGDLPTERQQEAVSMIGRNADRVLRLLDEVRLLDQAQSGTLRPRPVTVDSVQLLDDVLNRTDTPSHDVRIVVDVDTVTVDPVLIERALENLLRNAIQHTPAGTQVTLHVDRTDDTYRFTVTDNGPGFAPDVIGAGADATPSTTEAGSGGYGLGLSLVHRYVEAHGGTVSIVNRPEGGAQAVIAIPAASPTLS